MTYRRELDELRRELRKDVAGTITWWPKRAGKNVLASTTAAEVSAIVTSPAGVTLETIADASSYVADVGSPAEYSSVAFPISAISTLDEDYQLRITWRERGASVDHFEVVPFDVVLWPFGDPAISLNDLMEERPDAEVLCQRLGERLGFSTSTAAEDYAGVVAVNARLELEALIRDQVESDKRDSQATPGSISSSAGVRFMRPNLVISRDRLKRVERKLAMRALYQADMSEPEGADESAGLYRHFDAEVQRTWRGVGPLKYDAAEDLVPETTVSELARVVRCRRSW